MNAKEWDHPCTQHIEYSIFNLYILQGPSKNKGHPYYKLGFITVMHYGIVSGIEQRKVSWEI